MVAEIDPFVWYQPSTIYNNLAKSCKLKLKYFFTLSTKYMKLCYLTILFYAESNEHKIGAWMLKLTDLLSLKVGFKNTTCRKMSKLRLLFLTY